MANWRRGRSDLIGRFSDTDGSIISSISGTQRGNSAQHARRDFGFSVASSRPTAGPSVRSKYSDARQFLRARDVLRLPKVPLQSGAVVPLKPP